MTHPRHLLPRTLRRLTAVACAVLLLGAPATAVHAMTAAATAAGTAARTGPLDPHVVARFAPVDNTFAESLAVDSHGAMLVSKTVWGTDVNTGRVVKVSATGHKSFFGPRFDLGATGMLVGIAVDGRDRVFVARYDFGGTTSSAIYRLTRESAIPVATFPLGAWPNGLAFHEGRLYVTDSALGNVWRFRPTAHTQDLVHPWLHRTLLTPATGEMIGANGLAFWRDTLYVVNYTRGTLVKVTQGPKGHAGTPHRVVKRQRLLTADGIAFDARGTLWVVANGKSKSTAPPHDQYLLRMSRTGAIERSWKDAHWMNYPTMPAFGRTAATAHRLFVTNGAFYGGQANLVSLRLR